MPGSPDTLLHLIRQAAPVPVSTPRVLKLDDWAYRKGKRYGTLLLDLERRVPIDLLPDREVESCVAWLQAHPGVEIISRDRGDIYVEACREDAPQAKQVADRWHLLRNLDSAIHKLLGRHAGTLRQVARAVDHLPDTSQPPSPSSQTDLDEPPPRLPSSAD